MSFENQQEQAPDKLVGTVIGGRYKILSKLGEGGMGCVYVAEQQLGSNARKVAVKTLHPHLSHDPKILARFEREVGTVSELQHPNTIQVFDFGKTAEGTLYIVMEFVEGRSVADILEKDGPMEPSRVEKILTQVVGSLAEAHGHGIVHRDLKPDNIVLCNKAGQTDWVEVLDFGIAKRASEEDKDEAKLTQQGMVLGTPPYMSPEQFTGKPVDARSDIYALGVMSYEMLSGRLPFSGNTAWEWATAHMTAQPAPIDLTPAGPHIPPRMKAAIARCLAKAPEDRFANVTEFLAAFTGSGGAPQYAANVDSAGARGRTEVGTPIAPPVGGGAGGYGGPPPGGGYGPPPGSGGAGNYGAPVQATYGTPPAGNHAMNAGGVGVPAGPGPRTHGGGGGGKGPLLAVAGVIALLSIGAVVFAMKGSSSKSTGGLDLTGYDAGTSAPMTDIGTPTPEATAAPVAQAFDASLDPIKPTTPTRTSTPTHTPAKDAGGAPATIPTVMPTTIPTTLPTHVPTAIPTTVPTVPPASAEPRECANARLLYSVGNRPDGDKLAKLCRDKGGHL